MGKPKAKLYLKFRQPDGKQSSYCPAVFDKKSRLRPFWCLVKGTEEFHPLMHEDQPGFWEVSARTITLQVPDWPGHIAGQHVDVRLTAPDGYSAVRSYSIASAPNSEGRVEPLTVERLPNGEVSP